eukprot:11167800-Lingulodinium_polyedra.AAC.1
MHQQVATIVHCHCLVRRPVPDSMCRRSHRPSSWTAARGAWPRAPRIAWAAAASAGARGSSGFPLALEPRGPA